MRESLICLLLAAAMAGSAGAAEIDIPAQDLAGALSSLARQTGIQLLYRPEEVRGLQAQALTGELEPRDALARLLKGSGFAARQSGLSYVVVRVDEPGSAVALPDLTVSAGRLGDTEGYRALSTRAATKTDTPLLETPISVQTVTREVIADRQYTRLADVIENISGVAREPSVGEGSRFIVRGFHQDRVFRDGLQANGVNARFPTDYDLATAESVEVVKGPASLNYGRIEPGGLINITTKKPLASSQHSVTVESGSFKHARVDADSTGPLDAAGHWRYRLVVAAQDSETFKDFSQDDRLVFAPSVMWKRDDDTDLRVALEYFRSDNVADFGWPAMGDRPARLPVERNLATDPNDPTQDRRERSQINTELNHRFSPDWTLRHRFQYGRQQNDEDFINPAPAFGNALQGDGRTLNRNIFWQSNDTDAYATNLDLLGSLRVGSTTHRLLLGADYLQGRTHYYTGGNFQTPDPALAIDIFNPVYGIDPAKFADVLNVYSNHSVFKDRVLGLYVQDQIQFNEGWQFLIGGRQDWASTGRGAGANEAIAEANVPKRRDDAFSPRLAALYQFAPAASTYLSWSRSFGQNNGISATGGTFDPQIGEQYEWGLKAELFNSRMFANLALYHLTKSNLLTADLSTADPNDSIAIGEQRSRGLELDISGQAGPRLSLIASYAYTDAEVTRDNNGNQGKRLPSVARHAASLWGKYAITSDFSVGLGGVAVGARYGDLANTFVLPGYARLDAMAAYRFKAGGQVFRAQLNIRNLFDTYYYEVATAGLNVGSRNGVFVGAPRSVVASLRMEF